MNDLYCKKQVNCENCIFRKKGCQILNDQLFQSDKNWLYSISNANQLNADKSFILNQMLFYILSFAKRKKSIETLCSQDIKNYCLAGEDTYLIDCLWLCIYYGQITPARILSNYIFKKYGNYIQKIAYALNDHIHCSPDEIIQRVYIAFTNKQYKALTDFKGVNMQFKTYLTTITKRKISECLRNVHSIHTTDQIEEVSDTSQENQTISPDQAFIQKEFTQLLENILLNGINRISSSKIMDVHIMLWRIQGLSFQSIAKKLGINKSNTVSHRYHRAKEKLINYVRQELRQQYHKDLSDFDPDDIYISIKNMLQNKINNQKQTDSIKKVNHKSQMMEMVSTDSTLENLLKELETEQIHQE